MRTGVNKNKNSNMAKFAPKNKKSTKEQAPAAGFWKTHPKRYSITEKEDPAAYALVLTKINQT